MHHLHSTVLYLLVAIPLVAGILWRITTWRHVRSAMLVAACVCGTVGLGLIIYHFNDERRPLESYAGYHAVEEKIEAWIGGASDVTARQPARMHLRRMLHAPARPATYVRVLAGLVVVAVFFAAGALMALLGPIVAGYTGSMVLNAWFHNQPVGDIFLWRDFFETFRINSMTLQVTCFLIGSLTSAGDVLLALFTRKGPRAGPAPQRAAGAR
jgi:hypothetical protein